MKKDFEPTHRIAHQTSEGNQAVFVMLVEGQAYTESEWLAGAPASYQRDETYYWTFQGQTFSGVVTRV